jgi:hypothetical protein
MRTTLLAGLAAAGILLLGASHSSAAPASGSVIGSTADLATALQDARWYIHRRCWHRASTSYRWCRSWRVWRPY